MAPWRQALDADTIAASLQAGRGARSICSPSNRPCIATSCLFQQIDDCEAPGDRRDRAPLTLRGRSPGLAARFGLRCLRLRPPKPSSRRSAIAVKQRHRQGGHPGPGVARNDGHPSSRAIPVSCRPGTALADRQTRKSARENVRLRSEAGRHFCSRLAHAPA